MKNILRQAQETGVKIASPFQSSVLREESEKQLAAQIPKVAASVNTLRDGRQYEQALAEISRLRPPIDLFFEKVMVMTDDENLRAHRLGLLQTLIAEFSGIADFSAV
jgi:glycyl-tRNA synthetase beta chain